MKKTTQHLSMLLIVTFLFGLPNSQLFAQSGHVNAPNLPLPELPEQLVKKLGIANMPSVSNYLKGWYYVPETVTSLENFSKAVFTKGPLTTEMVWMLDVVTSANNDCLYCLCAGFLLANSLGVEKETLISIQEDIDGANLSVKDKSLLLLAKALTRKPTSVRSFVHRAKESGWTDEEIGHAIQVTAAMNMNNRMAEGFGYPPDWLHPYEPGASVPIKGCGTEAEIAKILEWLNAWN